MSQNLDIGFSFCFMLCRGWNFEINNKNIKSLPFWSYNVDLPIMHICYIKLPIRSPDIRPEKMTKLTTSGRGL